MSPRASFILRVSIAAIIGGALVGWVLYIALSAKTSDDKCGGPGCGRQATPTMATVITSHAPALDKSAPCPRPSTPPTRSFTPDGYAHVRVRNGASWARGTSNKRPNMLRLASGSTVTLNRNTSLVQPCRGNTCYAYVGLRPKTHVAEWIFGIAHWGNDPANVDGGVWDVNGGRVIMSNGLRLSRASQATIPPIAEMRQWGDVEFVAVDSQGAVQQIDNNNGCL